MDPEKHMEEYYKRIAPKPLTPEDEAKHDKVCKVLGWPGRMIWASKGDYCRRFPKRMPVFNANLCIASRKLWYGDLDLVSDRKLLQAVADTLGEKIYILSEMDARFERENEPLLDQARGTFEPKGKARAKA